MKINRRMFLKGAAVAASVAAVPAVIANTEPKSIAQVIADNGVSLEAPRYPESKTKPFEYDYDLGEFHIAHAETLLLQIGERFPNYLYRCIATHKTNLSFKKSIQMEYEDRAYIGSKKHKKDLYNILKSI